MAHWWLSDPHLRLPTSQEARACAMVMISMWRVFHIWLNLQCAISCGCTTDGHLRCWGSISLDFIGPKNSWVWLFFSVFVWSLYIFIHSMIMNMKSLFIPNNYRIVYSFMNMFKTLCEPIPSSLGQATSIHDRLMMCGGYDDIHFLKRGISTRTTGVAFCQHGTDLHQPSYIIQYPNAASGNCSRKIKENQGKSRKIRIWCILQVPSVPHISMAPLPAWRTSDRMVWGSHQYFGWDTMWRDTQSVVVCSSLNHCWSVTSDA